MKKHLIIGFGAPTDSALILAWAEIVPVHAASNNKLATAPAARPAKSNLQTPAPRNLSVSPAQITVIPRGSGRNIINVSKGQKPPVGLEPKKATESAVLTFRPSSAAADKVAPGKSNWAQSAVTLKP